jgi:hypothetical protein
MANVKVKIALKGKKAEEFLKTGELSSNKPSEKKIVYRHTTEPKPGAR